MALLVGAIVLPFPVLAVNLDIVNSHIAAEKFDLKADGIDNTRIIVTLQNTNFAPVVNATVMLNSDRKKSDDIIAENSKTDILGKAYFRVSSLRNGTAIFSALVNGQALQHTVTIHYTGGLIADVHAGDLIKIPDDNNTATLSDTAVYYYASDGRRYVFPNEKVYYTWYSDFSKVKVLSLKQMSLIPIGGNVTYKAGSKLVKFQTDVKTYLPTKGGVLRWVKTEAIARGLFGNTWNTQVDDISEAFYANYTFGKPIASALDAPLDVIRSSGLTIDSDKGLN